MPKLPVSLIKAVVAASIAVVSLAGPAGAIPPERVTQTLDFSEPEDAFECSSGEVVLAGFTLNRTVTTYFDQSDAPVRRVRDFSFEGTMYSEDLSRSAPWSGHGHAVEDLASGTLTVTRIERAELPGPDATLAGRMLFTAEDEIITGHTFETFEAAVCEYLYAGRAEL